LKSVPLHEVVEINPRGPSGQISPPDVVDFVPMADVKEDGTMYVSSQRDYSDVSKGYTAFKNGDVLLAKITPCYENNKIAVANVTTEWAYGSTEFHVLRVDERNLFAPYLAYFLRQDAVRNEGEKRMTGSGGQRRVPKAFLETLEIPLPLLEEQKRIAAILDQADALRRLRARALDRLNGLRQAIFHELFSGLDERSPLVTLGSVSRKITDGTHQSPEWAETGVPFIFVSNVRNQTVSLETKKFVTQGEFQSLLKRTDLAVGDVLYTTVGSYGNAGVVRDKAPFVFQRHIAHIKPDPEKIDPIYLSHALEASELRRQADQAATGVAQKTVSLSSIKKFTFRLPSLEAQKSLRAAVEALESQMEQAHRSQYQIDALFAALQLRAFRGELSSGNRS